MSVISDTHTAVIYDAKSTKPFTGQRLVVTIAKKDKDGNYGIHLQQTMATSVPTLRAENVDFTSSVVQSVCVEYFATIQNAIISERIKSGQREVTTAELSQSAILAHLLSDSNGGGDKWDSARVAGWFTEVLAEHIGVALIEKGFDDERLETALKAYEKLLSECLGSRAVIPRKKAVEISKALRLAPTGDPILSRFITRIDKVLAEDSLTDALGL